MTFTDRLRDRMDPATLPRAYYQDRLSGQLASELIGFARGVLADGVVSDADVEALFMWLVANPDTQAHFPGRELSRRLLQIMDDGVVSEDERTELSAYLSAMIGGLPSERADGPAPTRLPLDAPPPSLTFNGAIFVFTGEFAFGTRAACSAFTASLGGQIGSTVTKKTDCLVVGAMASPAWISSSFGRKIMKACEHRDRGQPIAIVEEGHWLAEARRSPGAVEAR